MLRGCHFDSPFSNRSGSKMVYAGLRDAKPPKSAVLGCTLFGVSHGQHYCEARAARPFGPFTVSISWAIDATMEPDRPWQT